MCGSSPNAPPPPAQIPEAPRAPDISSSQAGGADKRRRAVSSGQARGRSTILTSARGVTDGAATATKTLLGQ